MPQREDDPEIIDILRDLLVEAQMGRLRGLFVVAQRYQGVDSTSFEWITPDAADLAYEVRTGLFSLETDPRPEPASPA